MNSGEVSFPPLKVPIVTTHCVKKEAQDIIRIPRFEESPMAKLLSSLEM